MKAFVMKKIGETGFMDKPMPKPGPNDAIVKTTKALICTSDSHTVHGGIGERHNLTLGHEAVGVVHEVGSEVEVFHPGDRVVVGAITPDWGHPAAQAGYASQSGQPLGAGQMIVVESVPHRQELARRYGAYEIVDFTKEDVVERIMAMTDGE